ncbi:competence protein ComK [Bacillus sp. 03113]|uniref:competence protein ComK n=1 Tax=Bacillus sp. 03113 TaxID=2578211 RepID=UPI0011438D37|nr:competence protein ComK [Bacillus sp. 03113]
MNSFERKLEEYEINPFTMVILPVLYEDLICSTVLELEDEILIPSKPLDIVKASCSYFGVSYEGRKQGTTHLTDFTHKVPIVVDSANTLYFFPTHSPDNPKCIWVASKYVFRYERLTAVSTLVTFQNKQSIEIPISFTSFGNQMKRTAVLQTMVFQRVEETRKAHIYFNRDERYEKAFEMRTSYWKKQGKK